MPIQDKFDYMEKDKDIGIIPEKDFDSSNRTLFLKTYFKICVPLSLIFIILFGILKGILVAIVISFFAAVIVMFIAEKISNTTKILYGATEANISVREQMEGTLKSAKVAKMNKDYPEALKIVNNILLKDPKFYDALFVKAQILHDGFNNTDGAKKNLKTVIAQTETGQTIHTWASSLYDQLCKNPRQ